MEPTYVRKKCRQDPQISYFPLGATVRILLSWGFGRDMLIRKSQYTGNIINDVRILYQCTTAHQIVFKYYKYDTRYAIVVFSFHRWFLRNFC
jgi:hypothetical protein